jgi:hypothetical protein
MRNLLKLLIGYWRFDHELEILVVKPFLMALMMIF